MSEKIIKSYSLDKEIIDLIDELSVSEDRKKSAIIERAIRFYISGGQR